jgi:DnaJ-class molecular chaperone
MKRHTITNPYDVLGVPRTASQEEIKAKYRELAMRYHPDKGGNDEKMKEVNQAYDILSDENKRREYDNPPETFYGGTQNPFGDGNIDEFIRQMFGGRGGSQFFYHSGWNPGNPNVHVNMETVVNQEANISCIDLMLGTTLEVQPPSGNKKKILIPAGTQNGTVLRVTDKHLGATIHIHLHIHAVIPVLTQDEMEKLKRILEKKAPTPA